MATVTKMVLTSDHPTLGTTGQTIDVTSDAQIKFFEENKIAQVAPKTEEPEKTTIIITGPEAVVAAPKDQIQPTTENTPTVTQPGVIGTTSVTTDTAKTETQPKPADTTTTEAQPKDTGPAPTVQPAVTSTTDTAKKEPKK